MPNGNEITSIALMGIPDDEFYRYDEDFKVDQVIVIDGEAVEEASLSDTEKGYNNARKDLVQKLFEYSKDASDRGSLPDFRNLTISDVLPLIRNYRGVCAERTQDSNYCGYQLRVASIDDALDTYSNLPEIDRGSATVGSMSKDIGKAAFLRIVYKALGEEMIQRREILSSPKVEGDRKMSIVDEVVKLSSWIEGVKFERYQDKDLPISLVNSMSKRYAAGSNERFKRRPDAFEGALEEIPRSKQIPIRRKRLSSGKGKNV